MPQLGVSVVEGTLIAWHKRPGEELEADEAICDVASDKVDSEIPAPCSGRIVELLVDEGDTVAVGTVIATMEARTALAHADTPGEPATAPAAAVLPAVGEPAAAPAAVVPPTGRHSPVVTRLASEHGVDLESVVGTGLDGRIRKEDVLAAAGGAERVAPDAYEPPAAGELSRMRRLIGGHMKRSLDVAATVTSWIEVDFSAVEERRRTLGVTALPLVAAATVATLAHFRDLNAWLDGDAYTRHDDVNLGIAVSLGDDGLIVPVIRAAQRLGVAELASRIADLGSRARGGRLSADEVRDGTFTITNPGQFGTVMATPVINQPEVAILDIEAVSRRPVVVAAEDGSEEIAIRPICILGLSWDHRALDGAYAAQFLGALRTRLEGGD
jgi:2-oxoglutarate dehydrogenase E2 component (dihydrolipoamide succinyltransferase)